MVKNRTKGPWDILGEDFSVKDWRLPVAGYYHKAGVQLRRGGGGGGGGGPPTPFF